MNPEIKQEAPAELLKVLPRLVFTSKYTYGIIHIQVSSCGGGGGKVVLMVAAVVVAGSGSIRASSGTAVVDVAVALVAAVVMQEA